MKREFRKWVLMVLTTLLLFFQPATMMAQEETASTNQLWLFWQHNQYFTSRFKYLGDIGYRHEIPFENLKIYFIFTLFFDPVPLPGTDPGYKIFSLGRC